MRKNNLYAVTSSQNIQALESRQLLSASVPLEGTTGDDNFSVSFDAASMTYSFSGGVTSPGVVPASGFAGFNLVGLGGNDTLTINGGAPTLLNNLGTDGSTFSITVVTGTLGIASTEDLASLSIDSSATTSMLSSGHVLTTSILNLAGSNNAWLGKLDLGNNDLVVHGGDAATVINQVKSGFAGGAWNGTGITSSAAAADSTHLKALGVLANNNGVGGTLYNAFSGESVTTTDLLVKNTIFGDANLDGIVDGSDYSKIDSGYLTNATGWSNGDFNYDGHVNGSDYTLIDNAFNTQPGSLQQQSPISLTVPTTAEIDLAFSDSSGPTVEGYDVFRSTTPGFTPDDTNYIVFDPTPTFQDSGLQPATTYYYNVQAVHQDGTLTPVASNVSATTLATDTIAPLQPTDLVGTGVNSSDVDLTWTDNSNNETGFLIEYAHQGQGDWTTAEIAPPHSTGDTVYELNDGSNYDFRVTAINSVQTNASAVVSPAISPPATTSPTTTATTQSISAKTVFIAIIGGNFQTQAKLNAGFGLGAVAKLLRNNQHPEFDVHLYSSYLQENVNDNGTGKALDEIQKAYNGGQGPIFKWALIGYSHGAGSAYNLDTQVHRGINKASPLNLVYSAYVQGVSHNFAFDLASQNTPPIDSKVNGNYFANYYEKNDNIGVHMDLPNPAVNHRIDKNDDNTTPCLHTTIDKQSAQLIMPLALEATNQIVARGG